METYTESPWQVIQLPAKLELKETTELFSLFQKLLDAGNRHFIADAADTVYVDSYGIGTLIRMLDLSGKAGGSFTLRNINGRISDLFRVAGIEHLLSLKSQISRPIPTPGEREDRERLDIEFEPKKDIGVFHLHGIINNMEAARKLKESYLRALAERKRIVFNFENLAYFNTCSVPAMLAFQRILKTSGGQLRVCNASPLILHLFDRLQMRPEIPCYENMDSALQGWE